MNKIFTLNTKNITKFLARKMNNMYIIRYKESTQAQKSWFSCDNRECERFKMPPLFTTSKDKIKVIEYGQHANDDLPVAAIKNFFGKLLKFKTA